MWLTRPVFWCLPDRRFARCLGGFGPNLDPSFFEHLRLAGPRLAEFAVAQTPAVNAVPSEEEI
jgi:hypothetical protein